MQDLNEFALADRLQLRPSEAAQVLSVSLSKVKEWIAKDKLKSHQIDSMRFVSMKDAIEFVEFYRRQALSSAEEKSEVL